MELENKLQEGGNSTEHFEMVEFWKRSITKLSMVDIPPKSGLEHTW